jgi:hypothetical protein
MTGGRAPYFPGLSVGEAAAPSLPRGMRRGQVSLADKPLKIPARETRNEKKVSLHAGSGPGGGGKESDQWAVPRVVRQNGVGAGGWIGKGPS